jgi:dolichol-phosphate mannosyltransferase
MSAPRRLLIVLATYNERPNIERLVTRLADLDGVVRIIVADDQSPDGTGAIADDLARRFPGRVHVLHRSGPRGYGMACREAMALALESAVDFIVQMDADGSHDPSFIQDMVAAGEGADVTIGSRYVAGGSVINWPWRRHVLSRFANVYVRALLALPARDCTSGFRCWRPSALAAALRYRSRSNGYAFLVEMLWAAVSAGASVAEVPIAFVEREHGVSKMSHRVIAESAIVPWRLRRQAAVRSLAPHESSIT